MYKDASCCIPLQLAKTQLKRSRKIQRVKNEARARRLIKFQETFLSCE